MVCVVGSTVVSGICSESKAGASTSQTLSIGRDTVQILAAVVVVNDAVPPGVAVGTRMVSTAGAGDEDEFGDAQAADAMQRTTTDRRANILPLHVASDRHRGDGDHHERCAEAGGERDLVLQRVDLADLRGCRCSTSGLNRRAEL
jgi:hypothetical protein